MVVLTCAVLSCGCCCLQLIDLNTLMYAVSLHAPVLLNAVIGLTSDMTAIFTGSQSQMKTGTVTDGGANAAYKLDGRKID